jgi:hypothetical protein
VNLHAVEACFPGVGGSPAEVVDQPRHLGQAQGSRRLERLHALLGVDLTGWPQCRRRHRLAAVGLSQWMRDPAHMPKLQEDLAAALMHGTGHLLPAGDLLGAVNAGRLRIALALGRDLGRLGNDCASAGALGVIAGIQVVRHIASGSAATGQRRHHDAIGQGDATQDGRREK